MSATFSTDASKRFLLTRGLPPFVCIAGLNPSKAGEKDDDPTIRKEMGFAKRWGYNGIVAVNLIATVATDPYSLPGWSGIDHANFRYVKEAIDEYITVVAWGSVPTALARLIALPELIYHFRKLAGDERQLFCIGHTAKGAPLHPSRARYTEALEKVELGMSAALGIRNPAPVNDGPLPQGENPDAHSS